MSTPEHDIHGLTAAYAVDALDAADRARVETHLGECADCRRDLREFRETAVRLAYAEAEPPPERIWERLRGSLPETRQIPPETEADGGGPEGAVVPLRPRRVARFLPWSVAAAALLLAATLAGVAGLQQARMAELAEHTEKMEGLIAASDAQVSDGPVPGSEAQATVVASTEYDMVMIVVKGLPPAPEGMGYQLWYFDNDDAVRPAGMLEPSDDGEMLTAMSADLGPARQLGISTEPVDGMPQPSEKPMMVDLA